ncbi:MAG: hypothetical protein LC793_13600 [Thermomicrobia bacterium]|nr:hypothetical protein [Thermomicrobia bacterium]MCA1722988.1 hypothetical protein [Thermomicrobia bacterium]
MMVAVSRKAPRSDGRTLRVEVTAREAVLPCPVCRARGVGTDDGSNVHLGTALHRTREYPLIPRGAIDRDFPDVCIQCWCDEGHEFEVSITVRKGAAQLFATWIEGDEETDKAVRAERRLAHAAEAAGPQEPRPESDSLTTTMREPRKEMPAPRESRPESEARGLIHETSPNVMRNTTA